MPEYRGEQLGCLTDSEDGKVYRSRPPPVSSGKKDIEASIYLLRWKLETREPDGIHGAHESARDRSGVLPGARLLTKRGHDLRQLLNQHDGLRSLAISGEIVATSLDQAKKKQRASMRHCPRYVRIHDQ